MSGEWTVIEALGPSFKHYFYLRPHAGDDACVVFVANVYRGGRRKVLADDLEACLRETFGEVGEISDVELLQSAGVQARKTVAARLRFVSPLAAERLLDVKNAPKLTLPQHWVDKIATGFASVSEALDSHLAECESLEEHESQVEAALSLFEADRAAELARRAAARDAQPDSDGFVTVTYKRKAIANTPRESAGAKRKARKSDGDPPAADFYRFQLREAKREKLASLRNAVAAETARLSNIQSSRQQRKFRA